MGRTPAQPRAIPQRRRNRVPNTRSERRVGSPHAALDESATVLLTTATCASSHHVTTPVAMRNGPRVQSCFCIEGRCCESSKWCFTLYDSIHIRRQGRLGRRKNREQRVYEMAPFFPTVARERKRLLGVYRIWRSKAHEHEQTRSNESKQLVSNLAGMDRCSIGGKQTGRLCIGRGLFLEPHCLILGKPVRRTGRAAADLASVPSSLVGLSMASTGVHCVSTCQQTKKCHRS